MSNQLRLRQPLELIVAETESGRRLDALLTERMPTFSRAHLQRVILAGGVQVDGSHGKASQRLRGGQRIKVIMIDPPREGPQPESIPLDILYEDESLVAVNKPPGMVVHPAKGHWSGTLASALRNHIEPLSSLGGATRPGIVHRLDRDTSGVIVIAKTDVAHAHLAEQFQQRTVEKEYFAIVCGKVDRDRDHIDAPIGPHPREREKMAVVPEDPRSKPARTFYEILERFDGFAALRVLPKTGRTHQIRVHLLFIGRPVLCDRLYGSRSRITLSEIRRDKIEPDSPKPDEALLHRQALHARRLRLRHPSTDKEIEFTAPLPNDIAGTIAALREFR